MEIIDINGNKRQCHSVTTDKDYPGYVKINFKNDRREYSEWYTFEEFKAKNPNHPALTSKLSKPIFEDLGRVTDSTEFTLTDKKKSWQKNIFFGLPIWISRGKGEGQVRTVKSNGKNTIIINKLWKIAPDKTSQYVISPNIHNPHIFDNKFPDVPKAKKSLKTVTPTLKLELPKKITNTK